MLTGKCTCDGSGFGGKTMKELLADDKIYGTIGDCMIINCPYCNVDTAGNHERNCPMNQKQQESSKEEMNKRIRELEEVLDKAKHPRPQEFDYPYKLYPYSYGWVCPSCGRGNAPWNATCPCKDRKYEVTC